MKIIKIFIVLMFCNNLYGQINESNMDKYLVLNEQINCRRLEGDLDISNAYYTIQIKSLGNSFYETKIRTEFGLDSIIEYITFKIIDVEINSEKVRGQLVEMNIFNDSKIKIQGTSMSGEIEINLINNIATLEITRYYETGSVHSTPFFMSCKYRWKNIN